jgi:hypothetical protein
MHIMHLWYEALIQYEITYWMFFCAKGVNQ